jgi:small subunit ribosomal protein S2
MIDRKDLIKAGAHWGHLKSRWCPRMAPYIWGLKDRVHLIDVSKTAQQVEHAAAFLKEVAAEGKIILWVGTKASAQEAVKNAAKKLDMPYVSHRWVGGTLSNYPQVKKSVTRLLHFEDILARAADFPLYTKKDLSIIQKNIQRREKTVGGIRKMTWPIGAVVLVDVNEENSALKEAQLMGIPVVAIVDTNGDPSRVDYVIPANDDTPSSVNLIITYLADVAMLGKEAASSRKAERLAEGGEPDSKDITAADILALEISEEEAANRKKSINRANSRSQQGEPSAGPGRTVGGRGGARNASAAKR